MAVEFTHHQNSKDIFHYCEAKGMQNCSTGRLEIPITGLYCYSGPDNCQLKKKKMQQFDF